MHVIKKIADGIYQVSKFIITFALGLIVVLVFVQIVSRYVFNATVIWATELATFAMIWMLFLGCSMGFRDREIIFLTIFIDRLSLKIQKIFQITVNLILIAFMSYLIYLNMDILELSRTTPMPILQFSKIWVYLALTVSFSLMIFYAVIQITDTIIDFYKEKEGKTQ